MKILFDAHMAGERESGNERYALNLIRALLSLDQPVELTVAAACPAVVEQVVPAGRACRIEKVSASPLRRLGWELPRLAERVGAAVLHVTYTGPYRCGCPVVATVHDVSYLPHPEWFSFRDRLVLRLGVGMTLKRGAAVLTLSEHSRAEICRWYGLPADRVAVTPLAADPLFSLRDAVPGAPETLRRLGIERPYILAVGNLQPRKNLARLVQAYARLRHSGSTPRLVIVGKAQWRESDLFAMVHRLQLTDDIVFTGYLDDRDLVDIYSQAEVFVYPSLYEGFGLPVLEAMACGVPVIASRTTSLPEVAGEAALLVDPLDVAALADALGSVLADQALRLQLRARGLRRAAQFTWAQTALATWNHYQRVVAKEI